MRPGIMGWDGAGIGEDGPGEGAMITPGRGAWASD